MRAAGRVAHSSRSLALIAVARAAPPRPPSRRMSSSSAPSVASSGWDAPMPTLDAIVQRFRSSTAAAALTSPPPSDANAPPLPNPAVELNGHTARAAAAHPRDLTSDPAIQASLARSTTGRSSVLLGLFEHPVTRELHVLLTLRSAQLRSHAGDVALPSVT